MAELWQKLTGQSETSQSQANKSGMNIAKDMIQNRDFLNLLAGIGSSVNPNGIGAQIGKPVMAINQAQAMGSATAKQNANDYNMMKALIEAISGPGNVTNLSIHPDGTVKVGGKNGNPSGEPNTPKDSSNNALGTVGQVPETSSYNPGDIDELTTLGY